MMVSKIKELNNGLAMPTLGLGVWRASEGQAEQAVTTALETGYQLIDTAAIYKNEAQVGAALKKTSVAREEIFVTTKLWNSDQGYESALNAFEASLARLGLDYVDLYLIHWPVADKYQESWRALEEIYASGRAKAIGVSNFQQHHLETLLTTAKVVPAVNQIELHPRLTQVPLRNFLASKNIAVEAWSPLGQGKLLQDPVLLKLGEKYKKTPAQIIIRWHLQNETIVIPKSVTPSRIQENYDVFDFELTREDMTFINALNQDQRFGADPDHFDF